MIYHITTSTYESVRLDAQARKVVYDALLHFNQTRYDLYIFTILPDHVHILLRPLKDEMGYFMLGDIMHTLKGFTAHRINRLWNRKGQVWNHDYFDRTIRGKDDYRVVWNYISENPVKEGLVEHWMDYEFMWFKGIEKADKRTFVRFS